MKKDDTVYLLHILDAIDLIAVYTEGITENEFVSSSMVHDAVIRQIEIIGEAARNVSKEFQEKHQYFNINYAIVWDTIQDDLPLLKKSIKKIL